MNNFDAMTMDEAAVDSWNKICDALHVKGDESKTPNDDHIPKIGMVVDISSAPTSDESF